MGYDDTPLGNHLAKFRMQFDSEEDWREFYEAVTSLRKCPQCEELADALKVLLENYKSNKGKGLGISPLLYAVSALKKYRGES